MAVLLTGNGSIFQRVGAIAAFLADVLALKGGTATARVLSGASAQTRGQTLETDYGYAPNLLQTLDGLWGSIAAWQSAQSSAFSSFRTLAQNTLIAQVQADASLPSADLTSCLSELARQMVASAASLNQSTVTIGAQAPQGSPTGTPSFVLSSKRGDGLIRQTIFPETLRLAVTNDSRAGATARQEPFTARGAAAVSDPFSHLWPGGSGGSASLTLVDAQLDGAAASTAGNLLVNGDLETTTTANNFDNWVIAAGVAGTDMLAAGSADAYTQANALKFVGDGATLSGLRQTFNHAVSTVVGAGGSPAVLKPSTQYALNFWAKALVSAPAAGILRCRLVDGTNAVVNDSQGVASSFTVDLTTLTTSFAAKSGVLRTPASLPSTVKLEAQLSTAVTAGKSVVFDDFALTPMKDLYTGGPQLAGFAGATAVLSGDTYTVAITNTMGLLVAWMERLFGLAAKGIIFPYSGSPTVADSVVS